MNLSVDFQRAAVVGLGVSNLPLLDLLPRLGVQVSARDRRTRDRLSFDPTPYEARGVRFLLGEGYLDGLEETVFRAPALRPDLPAFAGHRVTTDIAFFLERTDATVYAVTGSDGKTTTVTLTGLLLKEEGAPTCGNIGVSPLALYDRTGPGDPVALELSSFQLMTPLPPVDTAVITNITENHLNWHHDMEEYIRAKASLLRGARRAVLNADCPLTASLAPAGTETVWFTLAADPAPVFSAHAGQTVLYTAQDAIRIRTGTSDREILPAGLFRLPGRFNLANLMAAYAASMERCTPERLLRVAAAFRGVPHRLSLVGTGNGVRYFDSSIDSTPSRTAATLSAFTTPPVVICGGAGKGLSYLPLAKALSRGARAVVLTGADADAMADALRAIGTGIPVRRAADLAEAVSVAASLAVPGTDVLLSPAATSFDAYSDYRARGDHFAALVKRLCAETGTPT